MPPLYLGSEHGRGNWITGLYLLCHQNWLLLTGDAEPRDLAAGTGLVESIIAGLVFSTSVFLVMTPKSVAVMFCSRFVMIYMSNYIIKHN